MEGSKTLPNQQIETRKNLIKVMRGKSGNGFVSQWALNFFHTKDHLSNVNKTWITLMNFK